MIYFPRIDTNLAINNDNEIFFELESICFICDIGKKEFNVCNIWKNYKSDIINKWEKFDISYRKYFRNSKMLTNLQGKF